MRLFALAGGVLSGLALSLFIQLPFLFVLGLTPLAIGAAIVSRRGGLLLASLLVLGVLVGMARGALPDTNATAVPVGNLAGKELILNGVVRDAPSRRGQLTRLRVRLETARAIGATDDDGIDLAGDAIAWIYPPSFSLGAGDRVTLTGRVQRPVPDDDELPFSQGEQSPAQDSYPNNLVILTRPDIRLVNRAPLPMAWLNSLRDSLSGSLQRSLPSPQAELARALLLGQRDDLPAELNEQWRRAGTAHLLAISGLHVSVVLGVALISGTMLLGRRRNAHVLLPLALIWAYAALSGFNPPVVRAAIMGSVYMGAIAAGRQPSGGLALILAATVLATWDPSIMTTVSFQMTVAAMAGIIFLSDPLQKLIRAPFGDRAPQSSTLSGGGLRQFGTTGIAASLGAVIGIKPLLLHYFGATALFTIPASLLGTIALPPVLLATALTSVAGLSTEGAFALFIGWLAWPWLTYLIGISSTFAAPPFAAITIPPLSAEAVVLIYVVVTAIFLVPVLRTPSGLLGPLVALPSMSLPSRRRMLTSWPVLGGLVILTAVAGIGAAAPYISDGKQLSVHVLDVGQGDSILIESPTGRRVLIDGGPNGAVLQQRLAEHLPWWSRRIDIVILTHPSADHIIGLTETLQRYQVGYVIDPQLESSTVYGRNWTDALKQRPDLQVIRAERGVTFDLGGGSMLEILHPPAERPFDTATEHDDNSVVARLSYGETSFLFTADIYATAEEYLLDSGAGIQATVLKVAHQGSRYASSAEFLEAVSPSVAVITAGEDNGFGHPHPETLERLHALRSSPVVLRTDLHGTVTLETDGRSLMWDGA